MTAAERASSRADALVAMAEVYIAHHAPVYGADVYQVVVHVRDDAPAHVEDGPAIPVETAMRLSCDTSVYCVHEDRRGAVLDLGRVTSKVRRPLRRALWLRDGGCRFPGCGRRRRVDAHHVKHWSKGGRTCLANLCLLCRRHHTLVHEGGFSLIMDSQGQPVFRTPEGTELLEFPALPGSGRAPREWHQQAVAPGAVETRWGGEKVDLDYVVSVVCQPKAQRSLEVTGDEPDRAKPGDGEPDQAAS
jgi:hypothetical protein